MSSHESICGRVAAAASWANLPMQERIVDRLGDVLLAADEVIEMIQRDEKASRAFASTATAMQEVFDQVNGLMKGLAD